MVFRPTTNTDVEKIGKAMVPLGKQSTDGYRWCFFFFVRVYLSLPKGKTNQTGEADGNVEGAAMTCSLSD